MRLALETRQGLRVLGDGLRQELEGDKAIQASVLGLVHYAHAAAAQFLENPVMRNDLA